LLGPEAGSFHRLLPRVDAASGFGSAERIQVVQDEVLSQPPSWPAPLQRSTAAVYISGTDTHRRTFSRIAECARGALQAGYPVIVDAALLLREERDTFRATSRGGPFIIFHCRANMTMKERAVARKCAGTDASEAGLAELQAQLRTCEPLANEERGLALEVFTDQPVDALRDTQLDCGQLRASGPAGGR